MSLLPRSNGIYNKLYNRLPFSMQCSNLKGGTEKGDGKSAIRIARKVAESNKSAQPEPKKTAAPPAIQAAAFTIGSYKHEEENILELRPSCSKRSTFKAQVGETLQVYECKIEKKCGEKQRREEEKKINVDSKDAVNNAFVEDGESTEETEGIKNFAEESSKHSESLHPESKKEIRKITRRICKKIAATKPSAHNKVRRGF